MITKKDLENYMLLDKCIKSTRKKIVYYENKHPYAIHGKVSGSSSQFPYIERSFSVAGGGFSCGGMTEEKRHQKIRELQYQLQFQLREYEEKKLEIEEFILNIEEPMNKLIFSYAYVDGMNQIEIAEKLHIEQSTISKRISRYLTTTCQ